MMFRRYTLVFTLLAAAAAQGAPKEPPAPPPPPMAQPQNLSIFRARSVEIPLSAIGRAPSQLKFFIRAKPAQGRLGEIRLTGPKSAVVTYTHGENTGTGADTFTYAVQAADTAVSAPATVTISITEEPPALSVVHSLEFGQLLLGETREEEITIRNTGGGVLAGTMRASEPWKLLGSPDYKLARKQEKKVRVLFEPSRDGTYSGKLVFTHDARSAVTLTGSATSPLRFEPVREIELIRESAGAAASAALVIRNQTADTRPVEISVPTEIADPGEISIPGHGEITVSLKTKDGFLGALESRIALESGSFRHSMPLRVFALQPQLRIDPPDGLHFGEVMPRQRHERSLQITNEGGVGARLKVNSPREILLLPDPNTAVLAPGEKRSFEVAFESGVAGEYNGKIEIATQGSPALSIPVTARINLPRNTTNAAKIPTSLLAPVVPAEPGEDGPAAADSFSNIPPIQEILIDKLDQRDVQISWKKPAPNATGYVIEQRQLEIGKNAPPKITWQERRQIKIFEENDRGIARLENLAPGQTWFLRISSLNETGRRSVPSPTIRITSPPQPRPLLVGVIAIIACLGALAYVIWRIRQRQADALAGDAERIARLGKS